MRFSDRSLTRQALLQKKNKMLEEALQLALKAQEKAWHGATHVAPRAWVASRRGRRLGREKRRGGGGREQF